PDADVLLVAQQAPDVVVMPSRRGGAVVLGSVEPGEFAGNPVQALLLLDKPPEHPADPLSVFLVDDDAFARPGVAAPASLLAVGDRLGGVAQPPVADRPVVEDGLLLATQDGGAEGLEVLLVDPRHEAGHQLPVVLAGVDALRDGDDAHPVDVDQL